jgi:methylated-DNA-[protein]-cysteine S-methyltransferase
MSTVAPVSAISTAVSVENIARGLWYTSSRYAMGAGHVGASAIGCAFFDVAAVRARLWFAWSEVGLVQVVWEAPNATARDAFGAEPPAERELPRAFREVMVPYLAGDPVEPASLAIDPTGTPFQRKVWAALRRVPRGRVRSYGGIAADLGSPRAMRAVGAANGRNPLAIVVPCHRVVETGMRLGGYTGGLHLKRYLLGLEGVKVVGDHVEPGQLELI